MFINHQNIEGIITRMVKIIHDYVDIKKVAMIANLQ